MRRVAAIAVDAAEWWYLERLLDRGLLPNLARLRDRSVRATLETPEAYRSELVWARFLTGREPLDDRDWAVSVTFDPETYDVGINTASTRPPFFAGVPGTTVVALDLIHAVPHPDVEGVQVVGWGSHSPMWPRTSRPAGLLAEIDRRFGHNPAFDNDFDPAWHAPDYARRLGDACIEGMRRRVDIAEWLLRERQPDWNLFLTCISEFHSVGHQLWFGIDESHPLHQVEELRGLAAEIVERVTVEVDRAIGRLLELVGDDTAIVLFAMHGFQPADDLASTLLMPELFHRQHHGGAGLLADPDQDMWRRRGMPPVVLAPHQHIGHHIAAAFADGTVDRLKRGVLRAIPEPIESAVRRAVGKPFPLVGRMDAEVPAETEDVTDEVLAATSRPPTYEPAYWYRRHWSHQRFFALPSFADGHVRVNLRGRERAGLVAKEDYQDALVAAEALLRATCDPRTGRSIVDHVLRMRADDPFDPDGPDSDLLVVFDGAPDAFEHPALGLIGPFPHLRASHHSARGFVLVSGSGVEPRHLGTRSSSDLTPTVLALLCLPTDAVLGRSLV